MSGTNIRPEQTKEEIAQQTAEAFKRVGTNLLASVKYKNSISATTSYVRISGLDKGFRCSGGTVLFIYSILFYQTTADGTGFAEFRVDGQPEHKMVETFRSGDLDYRTVIFAKKLNEGNHKVEVYFKTDAGTSTINGFTDEAESNLHIMEFLGD